MKSIYPRVDRGSFQALARKVSAKLQEFQPVDIVTCAQSFATVGVYEQELFTELETEALSCRAALTTPQWVRLLSCYASLGAADEHPRLFDVGYTELRRRFASRGESGLVSPNDLARLSWTLGTTAGGPAVARGRNQSIRRELGTAVAEQAAEQVHRMSDRTLADTIWGLSRSGVAQPYMLQEAQTRLSGLTDADDDTKAKITEALKLVRTAGR